MEESTTFQAILEQGRRRGIERSVERGIDLGRAIEARKILVLIATKELGEPSCTVLAMLGAINDVSQLENLIGQALGNKAQSWGELLA